MYNQFNPSLDHLKKISRKRTTKDDVIKAFYDFCAEFNHKIASNEYDKDGLYLYHSKSQGGYTIIQATGKTEASYPFAMGYQSPRQFVESLSFSIMNNRQVKRKSE